MTSKQCIMKILIRFHRFLSFFLLINFSVYAVGCKAYSWFKTTPSELMVSDGRAQDVHIVAEHPGGARVWSMQVITLDTSSIRGIMKLEGTDMPKYNGTKHVRLQEKHVRLFLKDAYVDSIPFRDTVEIPMYWFDKMDYYDYDKKNANASTAIVLGVVVLTILFVGLAISSALSGGLYSCPYIHTNSPDGPVFQGELYADAITPAAESHDWMPLRHFRPVDGAYRLSMTNPTPDEFQHTNLLELVTVDHPEGSEVLFDKYGAIHSLSRIQMPRSAVDADGVDHQYLVAGEDSLRYFCGMEQKNPQAENTLVLEFKRPHGAQTAKLVVNAQNAAWLNYTFDRYQQTFGEDRAREALKAMNREALDLWMSSQNIPLSVWLETKPGEWKYVDAFLYTGPATLRRDVLSIPLNGITSDVVRLKLQTGLLFWEIDQVGLDFTPDSEILTVQTLTAASARDQNGLDRTPALSSDDNLYYDQTSTADSVRLVFNTSAAPKAGMQRSVFLHAKGYYENMREATDEGRQASMKQFNRPNGLPLYARHQWGNLLGQTIVFRQPAGK